MAKDTDKKPSHRATYATDKKNGGYLVRVQGPHANAFVNREVPVTKKDGETSMETLTRLIWVGVDTGTDEKPGTGQPCALYAFKSKPRDAKEEIAF